MTSSQKIDIRKHGDAIARNYAEGFATNCDRKTFDIKKSIKKAVQYGFDAALIAVDNEEE